MRIVLESRQEIVQDLVCHDMTTIYYMDGLQASPLILAFAKRNAEMANYLIKIGDSDVYRECEFIIARSVACDYQTMELIENLLIGDTVVNDYNDFDDNFAVDSALLPTDIKINALKLAYEGKSYGGDMCN
ncbi:unnamed protein product [Hymenolepis diminuta]|uniref:ANK_REP_REGION domain-containing protein n=1 Tax=Hymenolepis diminuta TaxID=6216 RepID=A0A0R3S8S7_HYMDI|nr:unnamed protein product [Hymenolepis diminuta]